MKRTTSRARTHSPFLLPRSFLCPFFHLSSIYILSTPSLSLSVPVSLSNLLSLTLEMVLNPPLNGYPHWQYESQQHNSGCQHLRCGSHHHKCITTPPKMGLNTLFDLISHLSSLISHLSSLFFFLLSSFSLSSLSSLISPLLLPSLSSLLQRTLMCTKRVSQQSRFLSEKHGFGKTQTLNKALHDDDDISTRRWGP